VAVPLLTLKAMLDQGWLVLAAAAHDIYAERSGWPRSQQLGLRTAEVQPGAPALWRQHDDLACGSAPSPSLAHDRPIVADPDIGRRRQVQTALVFGHGEIGRPHGGAVLGPGDALFIVVAPVPEMDGRPR
jgi:hypothetical protein